MTSQSQCRCCFYKSISDLFQREMKHVGVVLLFVIDVYSLSRLFRPCTEVMNETAYPYDASLLKLSQCAFLENDKIECNSYHAYFSNSTLVYKILNKTSDCSKTLHRDNTTTFCLKLYQFRFKGILLEVRESEILAKIRAHFFDLRNLTNFIPRDIFVEFEVRSDYYADGNITLPNNCQPTGEEQLSECDRGKLNLKEIVNFFMFKDMNDTFCKIQSLSLEPIHKIGGTLDQIPNVEELHFQGGLFYTDKFQTNQLVIPKHWNSLRKLQVHGIYVENTMTVENIAEGLEYLSLFGCGLSELPPDIIKLYNLRLLEIVVQDNYQFELDVTMLKTLKNLQHLAISNYKQLTFTHNEPFPELPNLKYLSLQKGLISHFPSMLFPNLENLKFLNLNENKIKKVTGDVFFKISNSTTISLRNSIIDEIKLSNATIFHLDFSNTTLQNISAGIFESCNISKLNLSSNFIFGWNSSSLFKGIRNLDLRNNKIAVVTPTMMRSLSHISSVDLGGNPFECQNCMLAKFQAWLKAPPKGVTILNRGTKNNLVCATPQIQAGKILISESARDCEPKFGLIFSLLFVAILVLIVCGALLFRLYRYEIEYVKHIWKLKTRSETRCESAASLKYDAFISYCNADRAWVWEVLVQNLETPDENSEVTYNLCLHERNFRLGSYIIDNVEQCLETSKKVIFVLSTNFMKSGWCKWELRLAQQRLFEESSNDFLILVELERLDRELLPSSLRFLMATRTYLEWPTDESCSSVFLNRLRSTLGPPMNLAILDQPDDEPDTDSDDENQALIQAYK